MSLICMEKLRDKNVIKDGNGYNTCVNGEMCGEIPPFRSNSANCSDDRNSNKVSPPYIEAMNTPSGRRQLITDFKQPGRLFTQ